FQTVVLGGIMATRHGDGAAGVELVRRVIHDRRGHHTDVVHVHARCAQPLAQRLHQFGTGEPTVASDGKGFAAALAAKRTERATDELDDLGRQRLADDAAYVVSLEDFLRYLVHVRSA